MDTKKTIAERVEWIKNLLKETGAKGVIYGNSGVQWLRISSFPKRNFPVTVRNRY